MTLCQWVSVGAPRPSVVSCDSGSSWMQLSGVAVTLLGCVCFALCLPICPGKLYGVQQPPLPLQPPTPASYNALPSCLCSLLLACRLSAVLHSSHHGLPATELLLLRISEVWW